MCDNASACVVSASPASGPRPQNRMPSRMTTTLAERILFTPKHEDICRDPGLSEEARGLLNALEKGAKRLDLNHGAVDQAV